MNVWFENIFLGISLAAPLGPVSIEMIRRGLLFGFWPAFVVRLGGALANTLCLAIGMWGLHLLQGKVYIQLSIWIFGALLLFYMGALAIRSGLRGKHHFKPPLSSQSGFVRGFILSLTSPIGLLWWLAVFAAVHGSGEAGASSFAIVFGVILWGALLSLLASACGRFVRSKAFGVVEIISGLALIGFAIYFGYQALFSLQ